MQIWEKLLTRKLTGSSVGLQAVETTSSAAESNQWCWFRMTRGNESLNPSRLSLVFAETNGVYGRRNAPGAQVRDVSSFRQRSAAMEIIQRK